MGLLWMDYDEDFQNLVQTAFQCESKDNEEYFSKLTKKVQKIIYRDTRYNIDFLYTAYALKDSKIMEKYAIWLYELMDSILNKYQNINTVDYVICHLGYIHQAVQLTIPKEKQDELLKLIELGQESIKQYIQNKQKSYIQESIYEKEIQQYLDSLFKKDMKQSMSLIHQFKEQGISIVDIYVDILAESMRRIGEMWHKAQITVDIEHYCTSTTQMAMSQMYPDIFSHKRKNRKIICACPGSELHEMGARMVADLFENDGWDSIYLGAAVPEDAMLEAISSYQPDLVALSVTMPQHLIDCKDLVMKIKQSFPQIKVAVGENAFKSTHHMWSLWPVDLYSDNARDFLLQAQLLFGDE